MLLKFKKISGQEEINVCIKYNDQEEVFSYTRMLQILLPGESFEEPTFEGKFSEEEKQSAKEMVEKIKEALSQMDVMEEEENMAEDISEKTEDPSAEDLPF